MRNRADFLQRLRRLGLVCTLLLAGTPAVADFQDRGMSAGAARTEFAPGKGTGSDYLTLWYRNPVPDGCAFSVLDPLNNIFGCPGLSWVRPKSDGEPGWTGMQLHATCGSNVTAAGPANTAIGDSWRGCLTYPGSPYFELNSPGEQYWVLVANSDPAFDQCNDGPPGLSHVIRDPMVDPRPALYKVAMERLPSGAHRAHLIVNASNHPFRCDRPGYKQGPHAVLPFLSLGAQHRRGQAGPVAMMNGGLQAQQRPRIAWRGRTWAYEPFGCDLAKGAELCYARGVHAGYYAIASWNGIKRLLFVGLVGQADLDYSREPPGATHWNWPIAESFFYPGAEVANLSSVHIETRCGIPMPRLPLNGDWMDYSVDITAVFACASDLKLFSSPMPADREVELDGFHWYIESVGSNGAFWMSVEDPRVD